MRSGDAKGEVSLKRGGFPKLEIGGIIRRFMGKGWG